MQLFVRLFVVLLGITLRGRGLFFVRDIVLFEKTALRIFKKAKSTFRVVICFGKVG